MSDQNQMPEITDEMKHLLQEVEKHAFPPKEKTFFSIEGIIGRYENPTSNLLRFFMDPNAGHDLGPLFLRAFFDCMGTKDICDIAFENVIASCEVRTQDGKLIDLFISAGNWVLLIENKIGHWPANPFDLYEDHAKHCYPNKKHFFAILSPKGEPVEKWPNWIAVSYQEFCRALKRELSKELLNNSVSKWQVFAREFIVHINNQLYNPAMTMTSDQTAFVESNLRSIVEIKKLADGYLGQLQSELDDRLKYEFPGRAGGISVAVDGWYLKCDIKIGALWLQLCCWPPGIHHGDGSREASYKIEGWVRGLTEDQHQFAARSFSGYGEREENGHWWGKGHFERRADAVNGICKLGKELFDLLENVPPASTHTQVSV